MTVEVPAQHARTGIIFLKVQPRGSGAVRVLGSRYFSIDQIKREGAVAAGGRSPNFTQVSHDLVVLNQLSDRQITPVVGRGKFPGRSMWT